MIRLLKALQNADGVIAGNCYSETSETRANTVNVLNDNGKDREYSASLFEVSDRTLQAGQWVICSIRSSGELELGRAYKVVRQDRPENVIVEMDGGKQRGVYPGRFQLPEFQPGDEVVNTETGQTVRVGDLARNPTNGGPGFGVVVDGTAYPNSIFKKVTMNDKTTIYRVEGFYRDGNANNGRSWQLNKGGITDKAEAERQLAARLLDGARLATAWRIVETVTTERTIREETVAAPAGNQLRMQILEDVIRTKVSDKNFDMAKLSIPNPATPDCGCAGCIGGWALALFGDYHQGHITNREVEAALGLDKQQVNVLCFPASHEAGELVSDYGSINRRQAADAVQQMRTTGRVDWKAILRR